MIQYAKARIPTVWFVLALISFVAGLAIRYWESRSNSIWMGPSGFPATLFPILLLLVSSIALGWCWLWSVLKKRDAGAVGGMFLLTIGLFVTSFALRPDGFPQYVRTVLTGEEWRSLARLAQARLGPEGRLPGPDKNLWEEEKHRALWSEFCGATQIQKLDPSLMIFVRPDETEVVWGGALTGHRAVIIFNNGKKRDVPLGRHTTYTFIADDIMTVVGPD
jgi:hypothetical protein